MDVIWKTALLFVVSMILLRISGKKSLSEMTIGTTVVMISIGAVIVGPLVDKGVWPTVLAMGTFVVLLVVVEWLQMKFDVVEKLFNPRPLTVIEGGTVQMENLRRMRLTVDKLEMRLRKQGVTKISDVQRAVMESNGELSCELMPEARPVTLRDLQRLLSTRSRDERFVSSENLFDDVSSSDSSTSPFH